MTTVTDVTELDDSTMASAKYAIVVVFGLGLLAAIGSWWFTAGLQRQPMALWGADNALLIARAPRVDALRLKAVEGLAVDVLDIAGRPWRIVEAKDITGAGGLLNTRTALVNHHSFDWAATVDASQADWQYALRFRDGEKHTTVAFAPSAEAAILVETGAAASVKPAMKGIERFMQEQVP